MSFSKILDHVIALYTNQNKVYTQSDSALGTAKAKGVDSVAKKEARTALKDLPEKNAYDEYLISLDENTIKKLCAVAYFGHGDKDIQQTMFSVDAMSKDEALLELTKNSEFLTRAKTIFDHNNINIDDL